MSILNVIKGCPLFYELYDREILQIVEKSKVLNLSPEEPIFQQGDEGNEVFLILNGNAEVRKDGVVLARLRKGDLFGEMVLLKERIRNADVICTNYSDILVISYDEIFGLYGSDLNTFSIIMLNFSRLLADRLKKAGKIIHHLKIEKERKRNKNEKNKKQKKKKIRNKKKK